MTSDGREGLVEVRLSVVVTFCPLSHIGYSRPNSDFTFLSASPMRERFSGFVKSIKGSLVNSETWTVCSAVAMAGSLLEVQTAHGTECGRARQERRYKIRPTIKRSVTISVRSKCARRGFFRTF